MKRPPTRRLLGLALCLPLLGHLAFVTTHAAAAPAQSAPALGGYEVDTRATGLRVGYDVPGSLAVSPVLDAGAPEAQSRLATGPVGNSISSLAYPGPLILGIGPLLAAAGREPPVPLPDYPLLVEATSSGQTEIRDETAAGSSMYAFAEQNVVEAVTTLAGAGPDDVLGYGSSESRTSGEATDVAVGRVRASMSDIVAIAGLLRIDSVVTELSATSDGASATSEGRTVVTGATFAGQPITIDRDGVRFVDEPEAPGGPLAELGAVVDPLSALLVQILDQSGSLNDALDASGIAIRLADPRSIEAGSTAERVSEGLVIEYDQQLGATELASVFDLIPLLPDVPGSPMGPNDFVQLLQARQVSSVAIAPAGVSVSATPPFELPEFEVNIDTPPVPTPDLAASTGAGGFTSPSSGGTVSGPSGTTSSGGAAPGITPIAASPPTLPNELGFAAIILAMLGAWVMTMGSRRLPDWAIDGAAAADACEPENPEGDR